MADTPQQSPSTATAALKKTRAPKKPKLPAGIPLVVNDQTYIIPPGIDINELATAIEASLLTESLYEFAKACWHVVEPGVPFQDNWHLKVICDHLEAVSDGRIRNLIINIPPRSMKSLLVSVLWQAWDWTRRPHTKWIFASYGQDLATRDSVKCRRLIQSPWYVARFGKDSPHGIHRAQGPVVLAGDQNMKTRFENTCLGHRISTSVGGIGTGEGGDLIICDDPHNVLEAESAATRETTLRWWNETMASRGNNPNTVARVLVMQRVHEEDLTADQLKKEGWDLLCLPMEFEKDHPTPSHTALGFKDPRIMDGELLWPARFTTKSLKALKRALGKYGVSGQLQQRPTPRGGGMFLEKYVQLWPTTKLLPDFFWVVKSLDTAYTDKTINDPTACNTFGLFHMPNGRTGVMLLGCWGDHMQYSDLRSRVVREWPKKYGQEEGEFKKEGRRADLLLIEGKGSGISLIQDLQRAKIPCHNYNPGHADKMSRASQIMPWFEQECFFVIESTNDPGDFAKWCRPFTEQLLKFGPGVSSHDDHVDTFTQAIIYLRDVGLIQLDVVEEEEVDELAEYRAKKSQGVYG